MWLLEMQEVEIMVGLLGLTVWTDCIKRRVHRKRFFMAERFEYHAQIASESQGVSLGALRSLRHLQIAR